MTLTSALLGFAAVVAVLTVIPGLDTTLVLSSALTQSRRRTVVPTLGISAGALAWGAAAAVGAAVLLAASEAAYRALMIVGAEYMAYLGVMLIIRSFRHEVVTVDQPAVTVPLCRAFLTGAWTHLLNPKIGAFYSATIPQVHPRGCSTPRPGPHARWRARRPWFALAASSLEQKPLAAGSPMPSVEDH